MPSAGRRGKRDTGNACCVRVRWMGSGVYTCFTIFKESKDGGREWGGVMPEVAGGRYMCKDGCSRGGGMGTSNQAVRQHLYPSARHRRNSPPPPGVYPHPTTNPTATTITTTQRLSPLP